MVKVVMQDMVQAVANRAAQKKEAVEVNKMGPKRKGPWIVLLVLIFVVGGVFSFVSNVFSSAIVKVTPKSAVANLDHDGVAVRGGNKGQVQFEVMTLAASDSAEVPATGSKKVEEKATGQITVYNAYSTKTQKLVSGTRFKSKEGKVYRAVASFTVPGATKQGANLVPGTIDVTVAADTAGESYNVGKTDFTIPGFLGTSKYDKFYAKSKTDMAGGYVGEIKVADQAEIDKARATLKEKLTEEVKRQALAQVPEGFTTFDSSTAVIYEDVTENNALSSKGDVVTLKGTAQYRSLIFKSADLAAFAAKYLQSGYDDQPVSLNNLSELQFTVRDLGTMDFDNVASVSFHIKGRAQVAWSVDTGALQAALAGVERKNTDSVTSTFGSIAKIESTLLPMWVTRYPDEASRIRVETISTVDEQAD